MLIIVALVGARWILGRKHEGAHARQQKQSRSTVVILNEKYDTWTEKHWLVDGRLVISTVAVAFAGFALIYDYLEPFPKLKAVLATCSVTYFILMGVLQLYQWYVEKGTFYQAIDDDRSGRREKR